MQDCIASLVSNIDTTMGKSFQKPGQGAEENVYALICEVYIWKVPLATACCTLHPAKWRGKLGASSKFSHSKQIQMTTKSFYALGSPVTSKMTVHVIYSIHKILHGSSSSRAREVLCRPMYILDDRAGSLEEKRSEIFGEYWQLCVGAIHDYRSKAANRQNLHHKQGLTHMSILAITKCVEQKNCIIKIQNRQPEESILKDYSPSPM